MFAELHAWRGIPITELSREQLLEALQGAYQLSRTLAGDSYQEQVAATNYKNAVLAAQQAGRRLGDAG